MKIKKLYLTMSKYVDKLLVLKNLRVKLKTCLKDRIDSSALFWGKKTILQDINCFKHLINRS